jgi:hypothetical protein
VFATVLDSYDYERCLDKIVPLFAASAKKKGGLWVFRPDSGEPVDSIMSALHAGEKAFGTTKNKKGFKVINGAGKKKMKDKNFLSRAINVSLIIPSPPPSSQNSCHSR